MGDTTQYTNCELEYGEYAHTDRCCELTVKLRMAITAIMKYISEGNVTDQKQWEQLFRTLNHAMFMKDYIEVFSTNLISMADHFLQDFEEWQKSLQNKT